MKVHYAGYLPFTDSLDKANINYVLDTFYELKSLSIDAAKSHIARMNQKRHSIIDSGLFTLMFGAQAGTEISEQFIIDWQNEYAKFVKDTGFKHSIVECDVQKVIGPEFAWEMRKKFKKMVPNTIINTYHLEDGNPDKLIDFADYIAVSIPELRLHVSRKERYRITEYISSKAVRKGKKVHLLGCTEKKMLERFAYCYSCDSTSWISGGRFNSFKTDVFDTTQKSGLLDINIMFRNQDDTFTAKSKSNAYWQAYLKKIEYAKWAGSQD